MAVMDLPAPYDAESQLRNLGNRIEDLYGQLDEQLRAEKQAFGDLKLNSLRSKN